MALTPEEAALAKQASFGDDIMKQREAAVAIDDIRYDDPPEEVQPKRQWKKVEQAPKKATGKRNWKKHTPPNSIETIVDPEVRDWLPPELRIGFGDYTFNTGWELSDDANAFWVTFGEAMSYIPRGIKQIANIDTEDMKQSAKAVDKLYEDEELKGNAFAGELLGTLAEPVGFMIPGGKAASLTKAIAKGSAIGGIYGGLGYVEEGQTRLGNTLLGGTLGGTLNSAFHGVRTILATKAAKAARKDLEKMERYWAEEMLRDPQAAIKANAQKKMPSIHPSQDVYASRTMKRMSQDDPNFSLIAARDKGGRMLHPPRNQEEAQFVINAYGLVKEPTKFTKFMDYTIGVTSTRIGNISETVKGMVRMTDYKVKQENHTYLTRVTPFLKSYSKLFGNTILPDNVTPNKAKIAMDKALFDGNFDAVRMELRKHGQKYIDEFEEFNSVMKELGGRSLEAGLIKKTVKNYVPRYIKDPDKYMKVIGKEGKVTQGAILHAVSVAEKKLPAGQKLSTEAKSQIIHRAVFGSRSTKGPRDSSTHKRMLPQIPDYLMSHYSTPEESVHTYIRNAVTDLNKRAFFGKHVKTVKLEDGFDLLDIDKSAVNFVEKELKHLSVNQQKELASLLGSRFGLGEKPPMGWIQDTKNIIYSALLGNPVAAATQLGDLGVSIYINGFRNTMVGVVQSARIPWTNKTLVKRPVTVEDWGVLDQLAEEFASTRMTGRWLNKTLKYSGFQYVDRLGKDTFVNAAYRRLNQMPRAKFMRKYGKELGPDADKTFEELASGEITPRVKAILFSKLADVQPISPSEVPQAYLNNPNWRMMYMFKTFMLKQVDVIRQTGYKEIAKGNYGKGMKNLMSYGIIMGAAGTGSNDVKSLMLGKDIEHEDLHWDIGLNLFKTFGYSEFASKKVADGKIIEALGDQVLPPYKLLDKILRGDTKYIPIYGQIDHMWNGGGIEDYNEKQAKKKKERMMRDADTVRKDLKEDRDDRRKLYGR